MQYGIEVNTYKRVVPQRVKKQTKIEIDLLISIMYIVSGILISRVSIPITESISLAPFGLAFYWAIINIRDNKKDFLVFVSTLLGYFSIYNKDSTTLIYMLAICILFIYSNIKFNIKENILVTTITVMLMMGFLSDALMFQEIGIDEMIFYSGIKTIAVTPLYYIFRYSISCIEDLKSKVGINVEGLISTCLLVSFVVIGIGDFTVFNISIQTIFSLLLVLVVSYVMGTGAGASVGVCLGFVSGLAGSDMMVSLSIFSVCGLMAGVFKDSGKLFASLAFILSFLILAMYSEIINVYTISEMIIAVVGFICIPNKLLNNLSKELNKEETIQSVQAIQMKGIKQEFEKRVNLLRGVLNTMSTSITNLTENDKLLLKNKESALVESLADRVCVNCSKKNRCWEGDLHLTYSLFTDMISNIESGKDVLPKELDKRCKNKYRLLRDVKDILSIHQAKEMAKNRLSEGRVLIANHINSMSLKLGELIREFENDVDDCLNIDKILRKRGLRKGIRFEDIYSYINANGRLIVKVTLKKEDGENYCLNNILPMINNLVKVPLSISQDESYVDEESKLWVGVIEETPKFVVKSYSATEVKECEEYSGDNYYFGEDKLGNYLTIVSDGMGSGAGAGIESKICIDLIRKYLESGYSVETAVDVVNSIMAMKFSEDEKFATLDFCNIDLYSGEVNFIKFGGVISFIKRNECVEVIKSDSLPIGIIDNLEVNKIKSTLNDGDIVVTITDGVIDVDKDDVGGYLWLKEYLENYEDDIERLSKCIIEKAKSISSNKIYDDMTVVVSKVYSVY